MRLKFRSFGAFLLVLAILFTMSICNWCPAVQAANQSQIVAAMGAGWNLGNTMEANINGVPTEDGWGNPKATPELFAAVKNTGFKTVRIPVSLLSKIGPAPNYTIDATWLARVKQVVDYAYSQGLYVLLDGVHGDGYNTVQGGWILVNSSDQTTIKAKYQKVWQQYANTFVNYDEHLIFESMNEVFDGDWNDPDPAQYANLNAYNQIFVDTVRQTGGNNATRWLLIPGWNTNINYTTGNYGFVLPTDNYRASSIPSNEKRIMISAHYYDPYEFTLDGSSQITQWGSIATDSSKKSTWGQEDYMDSQIAAMYNKFVTQGYPVVIGEYCATDKTDKDSTNNTYRAYFAKTLCADCKKYGAVPVYWDIGAYGPGGSGLIDRKTYAVVNQAIVNAIMTGMGGSTSTPTPTPSTATATPTPTPSTATATPTPSTATPTPTPSTATPTPTPSTATPTPTPTAGTPVPGGIKVQFFNGNTAATSNTIYPNFKVVNTGTAAITLSNVKVRYYFTNDGTQANSYACDYSTIGAGNVTGSFTTIAKTNADRYLEIGFTSGAGTLGAGAGAEVKGRIWKSDWSNFTQTNDYSFNATATNYVDSTKTTGYVSGALCWGTEP